MHIKHRRRRHDWLICLAAGATLGFVFLRIGARIGMRMIALSTRESTLFSVEGSIAVALLGALTGALIATLFLLARTALPEHRWIRGAIFWTVCAALVLRGIRPITVLNAAIFLPLFLVHGILLHTFWCRVYPGRGRHLESAA